MPDAKGGAMLALQDLKAGICSIYLWPVLGWQDIKQRYRRSVIGPFWLTISYGALILGMGPLYGRLLQQDLSSYLPYLAVGFIAWILISSLITEGCNAFVSADGYITQMKLPFTAHVLRVVWRNVLIFMHNFVIVLVVMIFSPPPFTWALLTVPLGVIVIAANGIWIGIVFGLLCARFRDFTQVVASVVQIAFFLTPVMWRPNMLGRMKWAADWNPLFHLMETVRAPLITGEVVLMSWLVAVGLAVGGGAVALVLLGRYRARVAYWL
jgi:ABC-type polysaccharide/polyol phosphate export permease